MTKLTIIITNYNKEKHISYNIELLKQKLQRNKQYEDEVEIQIYDDGSTDGSVEIIDNVLKDYEGNSIEVFYSPYNRGIGAVRQQALNNVNGDYFVFIDSDDLITEDYLDKILGYIEEDSNADIHHFGVRIYPDGGTCCMGFSLWDKVLKKSFIRENAIHFDEKLRGHEDEAFMDQVWALEPNMHEHLEDILYIYNTFTYNTITHQEPMWYGHNEVRCDFE